MTILQAGEMAPRLLERRSNDHLPKSSDVAIPLEMLQKHQASFLALLAISLLVGWRPLIETIALSRQNDEYTHILLILPISGVLVLVDRPLWQAESVWDFLRGSALLLTAVTIVCSTRFWPSSLTSDMHLAIRMSALVLSWIGMFVLCFGPKASRSLIFPLLFLFGLVPFPRVALGLVITLLQEGSAWSAHAFFAAFGVPVLQQGVLLAIPGLTLQIAQECSSIRSSSMLMVTSMVMAQVLLKSPWRKALVIGLAIPLSMVKNGLRIFTIAMLGTRVDPGFLTGELHHQGGILFLTIALFGVFLLLWILRRGEIRGSRTRSTQTTPKEQD